MATPQDDEFGGPLLDSKWTFYPTAPGGNGSYAFASNPGNITFAIPTDASISPGASLAHAVSLRQAQGASQYYADVGITQSGVVSVGDEAGVFIAKSGDPTTWVMLTKKFTALTTQVHAAYMSGGVVVSEAFVNFNDDVQVTLRITRFNGNFNFSFKRYEDPLFTSVPLTIADSFGITEMGLVAFSTGAAPFNYLVDYFHARTLANISVNANILLAVTNKKSVNGSITLPIFNYPPARNFQVHQHFETPINTLIWEDGVLTTPTLKSSGGVPWTFFVDNGGVPGTMPAVGAPVKSIYILDVLSNVVQVTVADDGAFIITQAPNIPLSQTVLILMTAPDLSRYYFTVDYLNQFTKFSPSIVSIPTTLNTSGVVIVRKENVFPKNITDGTVVYTGPSFLTFNDGPIQSRARQFYSVFTIYSVEVSIPAQMATSPVFVKIYHDAGHRFSTKFHSGPWWMFYSISRVIQYLVDVDIPAALGQFNIRTAAGTFLDLWGKIFGSRRFPSESDATFSDRVITRVLLGRTVPSVIISEVLKVPGVVFCEIEDSTSGSMFVGHSFIGFTGTAENPEQSDFVVPIFYDNPFYFTVRVKIKQNTNLDQIIKTIQDNKAAGTRFAVEILETLP